MRLIMAVSSDGYVARCHGDTMDWLGRDDKAVFRLLTATGDRALACGTGTAPLLPPMVGRKVYALSRDDYGLSHFEQSHPNGWLIGGQTIALSALGQMYLSEVHLCRSDRMAFPVDGAIRDLITERLMRENWDCDMKTRVGDVVVEAWRPRVV
jgi:dihydrofolate reductase